MKYYYEGEFEAVFDDDSWTIIANTSGRSEESQRQMQRRTMLYQTLKAIHELKSEKRLTEPFSAIVPNVVDFPPNYILSPLSAIQAPLPTELSARFPDLSASDIEALMNDHMDEIAILTRYIGEAGMEERVTEATELVKADREGRWDEDVEM